MMPKSYYVVVFFMLLVIIFLLIYIASNISWIKNKHKSLDNYINDNHYKFIRIFDNTYSTYSTNQKIDELYKLKDSLDAKRNFIEGLEHGKDTKSGTRKTDEHA